MGERASIPTQYLRVIGRLNPDLQLQLRPGYLVDFTPSPVREGEGDGLLEAQLFDAEEKLLAKYPLRLGNVCSPGAPERSRAVRGWVPFHPSTRLVRYTYRGRTLHEIVRAETPPRVEWSWQPPERMKGNMRVTWRAGDGSGTRLQFFLRYSHTAGRSWQRLGGRTFENACAVDFDQLPGGEQCQLAVVATDGINTTVVESARFTVALKPCQAMILAPVDGSTIPRGSSVQFIGQGYWLEEARTEGEVLEWTSSRDGVLGRGPTLEVKALSPGEHRITLLAGAQPRQGSESMTLRCEESGTGGATLDESRK